MAVASFEENTLGRLAAVEQRLDEYIAQGTSASQNLDLRYIRLPTATLAISSTGSGASSALEIGDRASGNRNAYIDLHGDDTYTDFGSRWLRANTGPNANTEINHRGTGPLILQAIDNGRIETWINGGLRSRATATSCNYAQRVTVNALDATASPAIDLPIYDNDTGLHSLGDGKIAMYANFVAVGGWMTGSYPGVYVDLGGNNTGTINYGLRFGAEGSGEGFASQRNAAGNQFGIDVYLGYTARWRWTPSGNFGAGTGIPTYRLQLDVDSAAKPGTNTWATVCDPLTKRDAAPFEHGLADLLAFPRPETFFYNGRYDTPDNGIEYVGYMADKVAQVAPKMVVTHDHIDQHTGRRTPIRHVNTGALTPMLHNAICELAERLAIVEGKLA